MKEGARSMEQALRSLLEHPTRFSYGALAISAAIASVSGFASLRSGLVGLGLLVAFIGWLQLWSQQLARDLKGKSLVTIVLRSPGYCCWRCSPPAT